MTIWLWVGFIALVLGALSLDLGVFNRKERVIGTVEALAWTALWVSLALAFAYLVYYIYDYHFLGMGAHPRHAGDGKQAALQFLTGYIVEKSLSVDNIVVMAIIFSFFRVPPAYQHRVLFWGILGALVMRGAMIAAGVALLAHFEWVIYVFGVLLLATAAKLFFSGEGKIDPERNLLLRLARKVYPITKEMHGMHFFVRRDGRWVMTPLFLVLLVVESSDAVFAVDSIPAVIAVTRDPFLVFTSNVFAILGLRALYFALAGLVQRFRYLKSSLVVLLAFIGIKMIIEPHYAISTPVSLGAIVVILLCGVLASTMSARRTPPLEDSTIPEPQVTLAGVAWQQARRIAVLVLGSSVIMVGLAMLVLPGPGTVVIPLGLAILATEFVWARRFLKRLKKEAISMYNSVTGNAGTSAGTSTEEDK